ncbi:hypothetical protein ABL78_6840 [Leptomonas seymouri]|uniref:Uncharacterized protein n=1 Tax=Leptomonas seymouri TaxID=5684 RepID=A0A0N1HUS5_LEPSE|nr:hypothetical protein ABL78_6840 [Leptomonas seymouri]|eukprot:KPI84103.1 hypothetical protein ABL78_6840 [Leptomonas seymouri]
MKAWPLAKQTAGDGTEKQPAAKAEGSPEGPVAVNVPSRPFLDVAVSLERFNPNLCSTFCSIVITAIVMGGCFVVIGIPPLYLDSWKGKRIYLGIMIPLLTILCNVLLYYVMQQPQRVFNAALMKMVKEVEHHSQYLSTAVDHVEKELNARGVNLGAAAHASFTGGCSRSHPSAPDECPVHLAQQTGCRGSMSLHTAALRSAGSFSGNGCSEFLRGIDDIDAGRDVVIATVHIGKEWRWFKEVLGQLGTTTMAGTDFSGLPYQRVVVRTLTVAVARVEKLILSLYFSSFLLQRINTLAPIHLWGASVASAEAADWSRMDMHTRAAAAMAKRTTEDVVGNALPIQRSPPEQLSGSGESFSESVFTLGNLRAKGSDQTESERPVLAAAGALDVCTDAETHMELTPPSRRDGFLMARQLKLARFTPLIGSGEMSSEKKSPRAASPTATAQANEAKVKVEAPSPEVVEVSTGHGSTQHWRSDSSVAASPKWRCATMVGVTAKEAAQSEYASQRSRNENTLVDIHVEDAPTSSSRLRRGHPAPLKVSDVRQIMVVQRRLSPAGELDNGNAGENEASPLSSVSTHQPRHQHHIDATPLNPQLRAAFDPADMASPVGSPSASPPVKPPLTAPSQSQQRQPQNGRLARQPGTAVVQNPSLTLHRGARFEKDDDAVFVTILVHVQKSGADRFSRLYAAQAHVKDDGYQRRHYFAAAGNSGTAPRGDSCPFTLFHVADVTGEPEGLTLQEQRLLNFVYCRPEKPTGARPDGHGQPTDLSSLAVTDEARASRPPLGRQNTLTPSSSAPHRNDTAVDAEEVDSFIVAMAILADRPMRLTFLPVHMEAAAPSGRPATPNGASPSPPSKAPSDVANNRREEEAAAFDAVETNSGPDALRPQFKTVPVLECVVDGVLCVVTAIEVTVDVAFQNPSEIQLVGLSLEDVSEGSERGVDDDMDSLADAQATRKPTHSSAENSVVGSHTNIGAAPPAPTLDDPTRGPMGVGYVHTCTVGQEFREVVAVEQESLSSEFSPTST